MKKILAIIGIILCLLSTSIVFATSTEEAISSMASPQEAISTLTGSSNSGNEEVAGENKNKNTSTSTKTENNNKETTKTQNTESDNKKDVSTSKIADGVSKEKNTLKDYQVAYGSDSYGFTAYVLSKIQIYSIPFCFLGIAISAIYQYVLGIRKLDTRDKGFAIMISIVTIFVIAQVLPLIFAIVVKGWEVN